MFIHKHYFELYLTILVCLALIHPYIVVFGISLAAVVQFHTGSFLIDIACHKWGTRNFEVKDYSRNNKWVVLLTGGSGLHNNHHGNPGSPYYNFKPGEIDLPGKFIRYFLINKESINDSINDNPHCSDRS